jgi:RimJ/RimL family protein N-acetyltransferase
MMRNYRILDKPDLIEVIDIVCAEGLMATSRFQPTPAWAHALEVLGCPHHLLLTAIDDGRVVGWCRLFSEDNGDIPQVELGIGLLEPYRLHGLGTALLMQALDWARQAGYGLVALQVHPENRVARHVFEKCGFQYDVTANGQLTMTQRLFAEERR